ncbi:hypothetical protein CFBP5877_23045 [Agrobacterium tumefaciens]|uniref:Uncharacterized protein n=1 Tax=Agrobacterium tumefaciens TaxID=358 RepID=A0AAE6BFJ6_AGRTU|nr:hypothetical protein CFBP5499_23790 [Agrobacterium tumefaciens]QCL81955.1 hypothetical protein CFBP5877_23045 [Agrobacterium tumefaciens]
MSLTSGLSCSLGPLCSTVILGPVPRICNVLILLTWLDPRHKAEDDVECERELLTAWMSKNIHQEQAAYLAAWLDPLSPPCYGGPGRG